MTWTAEYREKWERENPERAKLIQRRQNRKHRERQEYMWTYKLLKKYGLTQEDWQAILDRQNGECAISFCHRTPKDSRFMIDHDHETGRVRGILCMDHNLALGSLGDSPEKLQEVIKYLVAV